MKIRRGHLNLLACFECESIMASLGDSCDTFFIFIGYWTAHHSELCTEKLWIYYGSFMEPA